jgi:hypothetical protein
MPAPRARATPSAGTRIVAVDLAASLAAATASGAGDLLRVA